MSRAMNMTELGELLKHICAEHSPFHHKSGKLVKYVHPNIDMRDGMCFSITLLGYGGQKTLFHTQNECRDLPQSLYESVMLWLDNLEEKVHDHLD